MAASAREGQSGPTVGSGYALPGAGVVVDTDDASLRSWLDEFLLPGFDPLTPSGDAPIVTVSRGRAESRPVDASESAGLLPCFALDQQVVVHTGWRDDDAIVVADERYGTWYRIESDFVRVLRVDDAPRTRASVMRVVRELATAQTLADGSRLQLHAAALAFDNRIFLLAGPKRAGKTTLAVRLASIGRLAVAGNDRVLLSRSADRSGTWRVRAIPTVVSVRADTRTRLSGRFDDIPAVPLPAHLSLEELDAVTARASAHADDERLKLSPAQFARAAGVSLCGEGPLMQIVLISTDPALDGYALEPCAGEHARTGLDAIRFGSRPDGTPRTVFEDWLGVLRPPDADRLLLDELANAVPVSTLRVGPNVLHDDGLAADLLGCIATSG